MARSSAAELAAIVSQPKRLPKSPPWSEPVRGTLHVLNADSITLACLAEGIVPARFRRQCQLAVQYLDLLKEPT